MEDLVFISYSSKDALLAEQLDTALRASGITTWFAPRDVEGSASFPERLVAGISESKLVILLFTAGANSSTHVALELNLAVGLGKKILPLRVDRIDPSAALQYFLGLSQWLEVQLPLAASLPAIIEAIRLAGRQDGAAVAIPNSTRQGSPSSTAQLRTQRDALLLGESYAMLPYLHRAGRRGDNLSMLPGYTRKARLLADRLGVSSPVPVFDSVPSALDVDTTEFIDTLRRPVERTCTELEMLHDRRAAHAFRISYSITGSALYVADISEPGLLSAIREWQRMSVDVELPRAEFEELTRIVLGRQNASSAILDFGEKSTLFIEDRLLRETEFARYRASIWKMGCGMALAAAGSAQGAAEDNIDGLVSLARVHEQVLAVRVPPLPPRAGNKIEDSATVLHYMLTTLGKVFMADVRTLHGQRACALLEAALKTIILIMLYGDEHEGGFGRTLSDAIERSFHKAGIPSDLWSHLVLAVRAQKPFTAVKDLVFRVSDEVGDYLSNLVVASRVEVRG